MRGIHISGTRVPEEEGIQWGQSTTEEQASQGKEVGEEGSEEEERGRREENGGEKGKRKGREGRGRRRKGERGWSLSSTRSRPIIYLGNSCSTPECSFTT